MTTSRTIVGGRPSGEGDGGAIPRGIEVLLKKARVDGGFREGLREDPLAAAESIGLVLFPAERAILDTVPRDELLAMAERVEVPEEHCGVFLGRVAALMLGVLAGTTVLSCEAQPAPVPPAPTAENEPSEWGPWGWVCFGSTPQRASDHDLGAGAGPEWIESRSRGRPRQRGSPTREEE